MSVENPSENQDFTAPTTGVEKKERSAEVLQALNPEVRRDDEDIPRVIFSFKNRDGDPVRVTFHSREELPVFSEEENVFRFGDGPKDRVSPAREKFDSQFEKSARRINPQVIDKRAIREGGALFFVEKSPRALLDMAITLGADSKEVRETRRSVASGKATDLSEKLIDQAIAASHLKDDGSLRLDGLTDDGEALLMLALQGNEAAQVVLEEKRQLLDDIDKRRHEIEIAPLHEREDDGEALRVQDLVLVHMTRFMPEKDKHSHDWSMKTTFEATDGRYPRATQHFTMNHPIVSAGLYGNWEQTPIAVLSPFSSVIEKNGLPANLNTIDTFWEVSPGRRMTFGESETTIVQPGEGFGPGQLFRIEGKSVFYKTSDFTAEDMTLLSVKLDEAAKYNATGRIEMAFMNAVTDRSQYGERGDFTISNQEAARLIRALGGTEEDLSDMNYYRQLGSRSRADDLPHNLKRLGVQGFVESVFTEANLDLDGTTKKSIIQEIEADIRKRVKNLVIEEQIEALGFEVHSGGMWAWDHDSWEATSQTNRLGAELGVVVGPHMSHPSSKIEEYLSHSARLLREGELQSNGLWHKKREFAEYYFEKCSPAMRRMAYEFGAI